MLAHETAGAARTRLSLRLFLEERETDLQNSGASGRENEKSCELLSPLVMAGLVPAIHVLRACGYPAQGRA
jgi:hypothetical protein